MLKTITITCVLLVLSAFLVSFIKNVDRVPVRTARWIPPVTSTHAPAIKETLEGDISVEAGHRDVSQFASLVIGHKEGFVAATALSSVTGSTRLFFYKINDFGRLDKLPEEPLVPDLEGAGGSTVVVTGCFMPPREVPSEVLYLFLVIGVLDDEGHPCGRKIVLYFYDKDVRAPGSLTWTFQRDFEMEHPLYPTDLYLNPDIPAFVACLGNHVQGVVDDNARNGQALYVSTSDFDRLNPDMPAPGSGGGVLWFEFLTYTRNPSLQLRMVLKDAKLAPESRRAPLLGRLRDYYLLGFGSSFFVQSGNGGDNLLAIANQTDQDTDAVLCPNAVNAPAPNGYVQVYRVSARQNLGWEQISVSCGDEQLLFSDRLWQNPITNPVGITDIKASGNRFGHSLLIIDSFVLAGTSSSQISVFKLPNTATAPLNLRVGSLPTAVIETPEAIPGRTKQRTLLTRKRLILSAGRTNQADSVAVLAWQVSAQGEQTKFTTIGEPVVSIGDTGVNSGSQVNSDTWFGSSCFVLTSPNRRNEYLVCNDPAFVSRGRIFIRALV